MTDENLGAESVQRNSIGRPVAGYLVRMPESWTEAIAQVDELNAAWDALDLEDEDESARVGDMHDRTMLALLRTPAPDAAGLIFKIRELRAAGRIDCDDETLAQICSEIAALNCNSPTQQFCSV